MGETGSISRRDLLRLGVGTAILGGAGAASARVDGGDELGPIRATVRQGAYPVLMGDSAVGVNPIGYGNFEGGRVQLLPVPDASRGQMTRVNLTSAWANAGVRADWTSMPIKIGESETFEFWVFLESPGKWPNNDPASGAMGYLYFSDAAFANYFVAPFILRRGWNFVRLGRDRFTAYGNPSWSESFPIMRTSVNPCSSGPISAYFGEFRKGGKDRPLVCVMFDDGDESVRQNATPLMVQYQIPYTISVISGWMGRQLGARQFSTLAQLATHPEGTAFVNHSVSHLRSTLDQDRVSYSLILNEIRGCIQALEGLSGFDRTCFAAPYGEWSTKYLTGLAESGVLYSRCLVGGAGPGFRRYTGSRLDNPLLTCAFVVSPSNTPQDVLDYVDLGINSFQAMTLVFHDIRPNVAASTDYGLANFQTIVEGLAARAESVDFVTYPQLCQRLASNGLV